MPGVPLPCFLAILSIRPPGLPCWPAMPLYHQSDRARHRMQFLLKQAEIFQHFAPAAAVQEHKRCVYDACLLHEWTKGYTEPHACNQLLLNSTPRPPTAKRTLLTPQRRESGS